MIKIGDLFTCKKFNFYDYSYGDTVTITKVYPNGRYQIDNKYNVALDELEDYFCEYDCHYAEILREDAMYM